VPVLFLDTDLPANEPWFRTLTDRLYGGDWYYRLCQEIVLGIGGLRMLRALGHESLKRFHLNEGHSSLLTIELLEERLRAAGRRELTDEDIASVRAQCVFTTHTPVAAGHDKFRRADAERIIGLSPGLVKRQDLLCCGDDINMTYLALNLSGYVNGVTRRHSEVARLMFAGYEIDAITNGVHPERWTSRPFQELFDKYIPRWRSDPYSLRYALTIPAPEIWQAHTAAKLALIERVNRETNSGMDANVLTLGFARRAAPYKRGALPVSDIERLKHIAHHVGPLQIVFAGKAHPGDDTGKAIIQRIFAARDALRGDVRISYLVNYDVELAQLLISGVDVWLNTPIPPMESSGTSGMKAALNGVPSLSILDGWWLEGCVEGVTGWAIDGVANTAETRERWDQDALSLYNKLEGTVAPMYYKDRPQFLNVMRHTIALNGSVFNTYRMLQEYIAKAYFV
jgi:starch phosphorylase